MLMMTKLGIYPKKIQVEMWFYNEEQTLMVFEIWMWMQGTLKEGN
jgi:hypothetical protein